MDGISTNGSWEETLHWFAILDKSSMKIGFREPQRDDVCLDKDFYLSGTDYAVSPDQQKILLWNYWLYIIAKK